MAGVDWSALRARLEQYGQEHLLQFLEELTEAQKEELYSDISEVDLGRVTGYFQESHFTISSSQEKKDEHLQPLDNSICGSTARDKDSVPQWEKIGRLGEALV